jgi:uncharacterized protein (AIM24 family)
MSELFLDSYSIIGHESQTIQIILHKNEKININREHLQSASSQDLKENIYKNTDCISISNDESNKDLKKVSSPLIINLKNMNSNFEYICLSNGGKIMKIIPSFYNNLYIRLDCILAFNNGIDIYSDIKIDDEMNLILKNNIFNQNNVKYLLKNNNFLNIVEAKKQFCLVKTKLNNEIEINNFENLANSFIYSKNNLINDMIFISGKNNLYEKRLGEGESMIILGSSLVGFEGTISFRPIKNKDTNNKYVNQLNDIIVDGPGLIIFEYNQRIVPITKNSKTLGFMILIVLIFIIEIVFHLIIFNKL